MSSMKEGVLNNREKGLSTYVKKICPNNNGNSYCRNATFYYMLVEVFDGLGLRLLGVSWDSVSGEKRGY